MKGDKDKLSAQHKQLPSVSSVHVWPAAVDLPLRRRPVNYWPNVPESCRQTVIDSFCCPYGCRSVTSVVVAMSNWSV